MCSALKSLLTRIFTLVGQVHAMVFDEKTGLLNRLEVFTSEDQIKGLNSVILPFLFPRPHSFAAVPAPVV